jgi:16S rRNA processing protein RimM
MSEPDASTVLVVGKITGAYGIKGWVKIHSYTDPVENFLGFGHWSLKRRDGLEPIEFDAGRRQGKGLIAHIAGVDDRTLAESYRGLEVTAPVDQLPALEQGDYYWHQLQGLKVWCRQQIAEGETVLLGEVDYLIETGANDVLVLKACEGSIDTRERLIPYLPGDVVTRIDLEQGLMEVDWFPDE